MRNCAKECEVMLNCAISDAKLNVIPHDTEVKVNDTTYMNCSTSLQADPMAPWQKLRLHWFSYFRSL